MNTILDPSLTSSQDSWPLCRPESVIHPGVFKTIVARSPKLPDEKILCFMHPSTYNYMDVTNSVGDMMELSRWFEFRFDEGAPRYDFVNGGWERRAAGTPQYMYASFEDVVFSIGERWGCVVRHARRDRFDPEKKPCS